MRCMGLFFPSAVALVFSLHGFGQEVVSVHSGVVHFLEGSVFIDNHELDHKFGEFPTIKEGSTLRTEKGRAEILLTPDVFLRVDENSSIRMVSSALANPRVEVLDGSVIIDSTEAPKDNPVVLQYKGSEVRFAKPGVYRLDSILDSFQAYSGEARITDEGKSSTVDPSHLFFFSLGMETRKIGDGASDEFYDWAKDRSDTVAADNLAARQSSDDLADLDNGQNLPLDPYSYLGLPNYGQSGNVPMVRPLPSVGTLSLGTSYPINSTLFDPYSPFSYGTSFPFFPYFGPTIVILGRPYNHRPGSSHWTHWNDTHPGMYPRGAYPRTTYPRSGYPGGMYPRTGYTPSQALLPHTNAIRIGPPAGVSVRPPVTSYRPSPVRVAPANPAISHPVRAPAAARPMGRSR